jgi:hypothetical protein
MCNDLTDLFFYPEDSKRTPELATLAAHPSSETSRGNILKTIFTIVEVLTNPSPMIKNGNMTHATAATSEYKSWVDQT